MAADPSGTAAVPSGTATVPSEVAAETLDLATVLSKTAIFSRVLQAQFHSGCGR